MKIYKKIQEADEYKMDDKIKELMNILKDEKFGSEPQRKLFISLITSLHNSSDKAARKFFKVLGDVCTDIVPEIMDKFGVEAKEEELQESYTMIGGKKYKTYIFEGKEDARKKLEESLDD